MMQLDRYLGLYLSDAQDRLRTLNRCLLELESSGGGAPLDEAFRSVHTIKGMAATMGYTAVAELAHALEDRLDEVRAGRRAVDRALIDELLAAADALERANDAAVGGAGTPGGSEPTEPDARESPAAAVPVDAAVAPPPGTATVIQVLIDEASPLKAARATIIRRNAEGVAEVLGVSPSRFDAAFDGRLRLFVADGADRDALVAAIRAAGDVVDVRIESPRSDHGNDRNGSSSRRTRFRHVRVDQRHLIDLADGIGDVAILCGRLEGIAAAGVDGLNELVERVRRRVGELEGTIMAVRMVPVGEVFDRFPRVVRDAAHGLGKEIDFRLEGREIEIDREILEEVADPLIHLLRNSVDHGLETPPEREAAGKAPRGRLTLRAARERSSVVIQVADDGRGVDRDRVADRARTQGLLAGGADLADDDLLRILSQPGLSTAEQVTDLSGRGVGLDAVVTRIRALGGAVSLQTAAGEGTTFTLRLPVTLALTHALRVRVAGEDYAVPLTHIAEAVLLTEESVAEVDGREVLRVRDATMPLVRLSAVLQAGDGRTATAAVIAEHADRRAALAVDELVGREQIVVKAFDAAAGTLPCFSGVTLLATGRPALVLDPISVF